MVVAAIGIPEDSNLIFEKAKIHDADIIIAQDMNRVMIMLNELMSITFFSVKMESEGVRSGARTGWS